MAVKEFEHRYSIPGDPNIPIAGCPVCRHDLAADGGVVMTALVGGVERVLHTRLDNGLLVDVDNIIANGYHSGTQCGGCWEGLDHLEVL